jgi:arylsulfatase A-like enzyme
MKNTQPNIIFIMSDDHAAHAMSCYGSKINKTPNLDRIADEGARFDRCFCTNNICEPSRAAILTGTYNHVNKVTTIGAHIDNSLPNIAKELQQAGYQTAIIGKWHLGQGEKHWPTGFDEWKILQGQGPCFDPEMVCNGKKDKRTGVLYG